MDQIILLDLNMTLAEKTGMNPGNFSYDVSKDVYNQDLVKVLLDKRIFLITARTDNYQEETILKIKKDTELIIERYYFKPIANKFMKVHDFKKAIVLNLFKEGFSQNNFFGIESNKNTRASYKSIGVDSCTWTKYLQKQI